MSANRSLIPFREQDHQVCVIDDPRRAVVTLYDAAAAPDPTYATVLFRIKLDDGSFVTVELAPSDAQRLGTALNKAGGGLLDG